MRNNLIKNDLDINYNQSLIQISEKIIIIVVVVKQIYD